MSNVRNFRVIVNLSNFFHDHRNRVRIFINEKIKKISDLENRIEETFGISNFHLVSQNEYLPPAEDTRILHRDDIIWVMRNTPADIPIPDIQIKNVETECLKKRKKKLISPDEVIVDAPKKRKKKKCRDENTEEEYLELSDDIYKSKKKKHKLDHTEDEKIKKKEKKYLEEKKSQKDTEEIDNISVCQKLPVLQSEISSYDKNNSINVMDSVTPCSSSPPREQISLSSRINKNTESNVLAHYKKRQSIPTITDKYLEQNKVNIVKIEYLSGCPTEIKKLELKHKENDKLTDDKSRHTLNQKVTLTKNFIKDNLDEDMIMDSKSQACSTFEFENFKSKETDTIDTKMDIDNDKADIPQEISECVNNTEEKVETTTSGNVSLLTNSNTTTVVPDNEKTTDESIYNLHYIVWSGNSKNVAFPTIKNTPVSSSPRSPTLQVVPQAADSTQDTVISDGKKIHVTSNIIINQENLSCGKQSYNGTDTSLNENIPQKNVDNSLKKGEVDSSLFLLNGTGTLEETSNVVFDAQCVIEKNTAVERKITRECNKYYDEGDMLQQNGSPSVLTETNTAVNGIIDLCNTFASSENDIITKDITTNLDGSTDVSCNKDPIPSKKKFLTGVGDLLSELKSNESLLSESLDSDKDSNIFVTKRHRKRIRKRKKKTPVNDTLLKDQETPKLVHTPEPVKTRACPSLHLKFEDGEEGHLKVVDLTRNQNGSEIENESIVEPYKEDCEDMIVKDKSNFSSHTTFELGNIDDERILKSPLLANKLPSVGDIVAFKILRLSANYNPEISEFIVGRVIEFTPESKEIVFYILRGLDECQEPEGIFSVTETNANHHLNTKREFIWSNLIEPRLLT